MVHLTTPPKRLKTLFTPLYASPKLTWAWKFTDGLLVQFNKRQTTRRYKARIATPKAGKTLLTDAPLASMWLSIWMSCPQSHVGQATNYYTMTSSLEVFVLHVELWDVTFYQWRYRSTWLQSGRHHVNYGFFRHFHEYNGHTADQVWLQPLQQVAANWSSSLV